ncbi:MAG: RsmE family RNA methyltransferase, partial [Pseudomonadota bacterium]
IEKATELGVTRITPLVSKFSQTTSWNHERITRIALGAAQQCERFDFPVIDSFAKLTALPDHLHEQACACAIARIPAPTPFALFQENPKLHAILIGPEGGFSEKEIAFLTNMPNLYPVSLGTMVLRAETAAIMLLGCKIASSP